MAPLHDRQPDRRPAAVPGILSAMPPCTVNPSQNLLHFEGGNALSAFRAQALLPALQAVNARITGLVARHVHWVMAEPGSAPDHHPLRALLSYGDAYTATTDGPLVLVMPRLGTVSPWASKATDIARNCGLVLHRVERVTEYRLSLKTGLLGDFLGAARKPLTVPELHACAALLHDRMTESVAFERDAARHLFDAQPAPALAHVAVLGTGRSALVAANTDFCRHDDTTCFVIDCPLDSIDSVRAYLDQCASSPTFRYGMDVSDTALMTCLVTSATDDLHVHFVDGGGGGYTNAAKTLKAVATISA